MTIDNDFNIEDVIYLKHDMEQLPRMVTAIRIEKHNVLYEVISGLEVSNHHSFEMSKEKTVF